MAAEEQKRPWMAWFLLEKRDDEARNIHSNIIHCMETEKARWQASMNKKSAQMANQIGPYSKQ